MFSTRFLYTDVSSDITENDIDVVSDLWNMDGRDVYRGSRDPRYTHANVYWLYDEDLQRVGCSEHSLEDHADFEVLWFYECEFATLLQEEGWTQRGDIWSRMSRQAFSKFVNESWTTPETFLEKCLYGDMRVVTPQMVIERPTVYTCPTCGTRSLRKTCAASVGAPLDFPNKEKVFFVDLDMIVYVPPSDSAVWIKLQPRAGDSSEALHSSEAQQAQTVPQNTEPSPPPRQTSEALPPQTSSEQ